VGRRTLPLISRYWKRLEGTRCKFDNEEEGPRLRGPGQEQAPGELEPATCLPAALGWHRVRSKLLTNWNPPPAFPRPSDGTGSGASSWRTGTRHLPSRGPRMAPGQEQAPDERRPAEAEGLMGALAQAARPPGRVAKPSERSGLWVSADSSRSDLAERCHRRDLGREEPTPSGRRGSCARSSGACS
jgi:hypothetical protein